MGIFRIIMDAIKFRKMMKASVDEWMVQWSEQQSAYRKMSCEEFAALPDEELFSAAVSRTEVIMEQYEEVAEGFTAMNPHQKVLYTVNYLEMEVNNGGLCQFFVNSGRVLAPYISEYLEIIGAEEHKQLFDGFITKCGIDLNDLSSFVITRAQDFEKQTMRYPFDEYDSKFYELPSLEESLTAYVRAHLDAF